jgi:hypothetical protein
MVRRLQKSPGITLGGLLMRYTMVAVAVATVTVTACTDSTAPPPPVPESQLHFVLQDSTAPPLLADSVGFYAVAGQDRRLSLFYQGAAPGDTGEEFLEFEVKANSLYRRPDGTPFQPGDSILITLVVNDPTRFDFVFEPSGLVFNAAAPARLHIEYNHSNHDFNGDGHEDSSDSTAQGLLSIWRREPPDTTWTNVGAANNEDFNEIEASVLSFSHYAVAW